MAEVIGLANPHRPMIPGLRWRDSEPARDAIERAIVRARLEGAAALTVGHEPHLPYSIAVREARHREGPVRAAEDRLQRHLSERIRVRTGASQSDLLHPPLLYLRRPRRRGLPYGACEA